MWLTTVPGLHDSSKALIKMIPSFVVGILKKQNYMTYVLQWIVGNHISMSSEVRSTRSLSGLTDRIMWLGLLEWILESNLHCYSSMCAHVRVYIYLISTVTLHVRMKWCSDCRFLMKRPGEYLPSVMCLCLIMQAWVFRSCVWVGVFVCARLKRSLIWACCHRLSY